MVTIRGGGLAGASAAITATQAGANVLIVEKSRFPHHKVCGEFLSAEALPLLDRLGVKVPDAVRIRHALLRFARFEKRFSLTEPGLGISRYVLDHRLLTTAQSIGVNISTEGPIPQIVAHGRQFRSKRGKRLFGFKTHLRGPACDAVELYFFSKGYVGLSPVEDHVTNICGLMPEDSLRSVDFDISRFLESFPPLADRIKKHEYLFDWLIVGPLVFENKLDISTDHYYAGDALAFVDPFTGSGMLSAMITGILAGKALVHQEPIPEYLNHCRKALGQQLEFASLIRKALGCDWIDYLTPFLPGRVIYSLTRPKLGASA